MKPFIKSAWGKAAEGAKNEAGIISCSWWCFPCCSKAGLRAARLFPPLSVSHTPPSLSLGQKPRLSYFPAFTSSHLALARLSAELKLVKSAPRQGLAQQGTVTARSQRWEQARQGRDAGEMPEQDSVLEENLQPRARALGPLFITFDTTKQARLIYPLVSICSSRAFPAPQNTGWGRGAMEMPALADSKSSRSRQKGQAIFHGLRMGFSCPAEPGREEHSQHFPSTGGVSISTLLSSPGNRGIFQLCLLAPPSSCLCQLCQHGIMECPKWEGSHEDL